MRILVTGGSGSLGVPLVEALLSGTDHRIHLFGRRKPRLSLNDRVTWSAGDLRSKEQVAAAVSGVDTVLHLAALTHSHRPSEYDAVNVAGTTHVVEAAEACGVRRLVYFSSHVASLEGGAYARSKSLAEQAIQRSGTGWVILRVADVYGPGQAGALSTLIRCARSRPFVPIPGHGRYRISALYIEDLVTAILGLLARPDLTHRVYTLAGPETLTMNELVDRLAAFHHTRPLKIHIPLALVRLAAMMARAVGRDRPVRDQIARLSVERDADTAEARREIGFNPRRLEDGLAALSPGAR